MAKVRLFTIGDPAADAAIPTCERLVLAQGDSWFSIGAIPPFATSNLLMAMELTRPTVVLNCAYPGSALSNMVEWMAHGAFGAALSGPTATAFNALFISGGGNDLINAVQSPPVHQGQPVPPDRRLLRTPAERGPDPQADVADYISAPGWTTFSDHLAHHFNALVERRESGINAGRPIFCHAYAYLTPRDAPAFPGFGPWLIKAMRLYDIPPAQWADLSQAFIDRLHALITQIIADINARARRDMRIVLIDTRKEVTPAASGTTGTSNDWVNEIHPTAGGYRKLAARWRAVVDADPAFV